MDAESDTTNMAFAVIVSVFIALLSLGIILGSTIKTKNELSDEVLRRTMVEQMIESGGETFLEITFTGKVLGKMLPITLTREDFDIYIVDLDHPQGDFEKYEHTKYTYKAFDTMVMKLPETYVSHYIVFNRNFE